MTSVPIGEEHHSAFLHLERLPFPSPGEALLLRVSGFPLPPVEHRIIETFLQSFTSAATRHLGMGFDVFIHMAALQHKDGSAIKFSSKGREWLPKLGLGVWPDRPAPAIWTRDDFEELGPGEKPRTLRNQVFQVNSLKARDEARAAMLEWGGVIQVIAKDNASFLARTREILLPSIKDPCFNCFPFYVPLLQAQSLTHEDGEKVREWLCGASIYIRESPEDSGLLVIGAEGLHSILKSLGASSEGEAAKFWRVPLPG